MARKLLQLWHHTTADQHLRAGQHLDNGYILSHSGSDQFDRVQPSDTVWCATVDTSGDLILLGRIRVDEVADYYSARQRLGEDIWESKYHVIAKSGTEEPLREVDLMDVAEDLRFVSKVNDRLDVRFGRVNAQQLQTMRELTPGSAAMLEEKWSSNEPQRVKHRTHRLRRRFGGSLR